MEIKGRTGRGEERDRGEGEDRGEDRDRGEDGDEWRTGKGERERTKGRTGSEGRKVSARGEDRVRVGGLGRPGWQEQMRGQSGGWKQGSQR